MASGPFLICGMGHVGRQIALLLRRLGHEVSVVTQSPREDWLRGAKEAGITVHLGDARDSQLLIAAGIERAQALLATTSLDAVNIEIALDARRLRPDLPVVVRLFDQTLARSIERAASFGVRRALGVSTLAAPTLAAALLGADVQASFTLGEDPLHAPPSDTMIVGRLDGPVPAEAVGVVLGRQKQGGTLLLTTHENWQALTGGLAKASTAPKGAAVIPNRPSLFRRMLQRIGRLRGLLEIWRNSPAPLRTVLGLLMLLIAGSVMVFRVGMHLSIIDAFYFIVTTVTTTGYGDITPKDSGTALKLYACLMMILGSAATALLYSLLTDFVVNERFRTALGQQRAPEKDHVIVIGLGNVGYRVLEELKRQGLEVLAVNRTDEGEFFEAVRASGPTIIGDGRLPETLLRAGLPNARGLVAATDDDATNLAIALEARRLRAGLPTVVRLLDAEFAKKVRQGLLLSATFSTAAVAAPAFVGAALYEGARASLVVDDELLTLCEHLADPSWEGKTPAEIAAQCGERPVLRLDGGAKDGAAMRSDRRAFLSETTPIAAGDRLLILNRRPLI